MKKNARIFLALLTACTLFALCSCSPSVAPPASTAPAEPSESPEASAGQEPSAEPTPSEEPKVIHLSDGARVGELGYGRELYRYMGREVSRLYYYYIPSTYQEGEQLPLMLTLHGSGSNASTQLYWGDWVNCAEREGFIVVVPESVTIHKDGTLSSEGKGYFETRQDDFQYIRWNAASTDPCAQYRVDDVQYLCDLVDIFVGAGYADPERVYSCGFSHGAFMSLRLAIEAPEKFAGVAAASGLLCQEYTGRVPAEELKVVFIQGTADPVVPINGMHYDFDGDGVQEYTWALPLDESVAWFLERYGLSGEAAYSELPDASPADGTRIYRYAYQNESGSDQVVKYVVEGGGHTWPGGTAYAGSGPVSLDAQASELIWAELKDTVRQSGQ